MSTTSAAVKRYSHATGTDYWACRHDPTNPSPVPCSKFDPLPPGHPFAGFCRFNMSRPDSSSTEDFTDLCHSRGAIDIAQAHVPAQLG